MSDTVIEMLASLAGVEGERHECTHDFAAPDGILRKDGTVWNPFDYNDDAMRLAAQLHMRLWFQENNRAWASSHNWAYDFEITDENPSAAMRLAICAVACSVAEHGNAYSDKVS